MNCDSEMQNKVPEDWAQNWGGGVLAGDKLAGLQSYLFQYFLL